jgi:hypothetical protein
MGDNSIEQTNETKHLGLMRNSDNKIKVDERIRVGRKTIYALLGPGLHARPGTSSKFVAFLVSGTRSVFVGFILTRSLSVKISAISSRAWASRLEQANIAMEIVTIRSKLMREY